MSDVKFLKLDAQHKSLFKKYVRMSKQSSYTVTENGRIVFCGGLSLLWDLLIIVALSTAMRRGGLLNAVWADIDFDKQTIHISPKKSMAQTWEWQIKDYERRTLPLDDRIVSLLAKHQNEQPDGYPYVFVPPGRYDQIQRLRQQRKWSSSDSRLKVINNFMRVFERILKRAHVGKRKFHDLRATTLTNWFNQGMSEYEVVRLAGHSSFATTHRFYLAVSRQNLLDKARRASHRSLARIWRAPSFVGEKD